VTAVWGATFTVVQEAIERLPPLSFNAVRFTIATLVLGAVALPRLRRLSRRGWAHGCVLGVALFAGYAFQTVGLQYTLATNAAFVTGMFVVFTPIMAALLLRRSPGAGAIIGVALATIGLACLSLFGPVDAAKDSAWFVPRLGDVIVLGCAVAFAAQIIGLGAWASLHDALALTVVQLVVTAVLSMVFALIFESGGAPLRWAAEVVDIVRGDSSVVVALLVTALLASALGFWVQTSAQRHIPPTRTAIILTMEPVWAGVVGFVLLSEDLTWVGWLGCALILAGMLVAELYGGAPPPAPPEDLTGTETGRAALTGP
jgi:drug/metabolite transporter (DMT)-like permease